MNLIPNAQLLKMVSLFRHLLSPLHLGPLDLKNRIVFGPHVTNFAEGNLPTERHAFYYAERAKGGAALIIMEEVIVHPSDFPREKAIFGFDERCVPRYRYISQLVHQYGAKILVELNHNGMQSSGVISRKPVWAPSPVLDVVSLEMPKAMELEEIKEVVKGFGKAALLAKEGMLDGVEINAGQYSLIRQFLSPLTNHRTDDYGGSLENRMRLCLEVIREVRRQVGNNLVVGLRLCGDELAPWVGLTLQIAQEIAKVIAGTGLINYIAVEIGSIYTPYITWAPMCFPQDYAIPAVEGIKRVINLPVCATGSIVDPSLAEELLSQGKSDLIDMSRALIADPALPNKVKEGKPEDIRPCIRCNQGCIVRNFMNPPLSCIYNVTVGRDQENEETQLIQRAKKIMIIGGGPAGLEAARVSALRGHKVSLYEAENRLGGKVHLAAMLPGRKELTKVVQYLENQINKLGVKVYLGTQVTPELVEKESPDAVVVATGSIPRSPGIPGCEQENVIEVRRFLTNSPPVGNKVVIVDEEGSHKAAGIAEYLAEQGKEVTVITTDMFVSQELSLTGDLIPWYQRAFTKGITFLPQCAVVKIEGKRVLIRDNFSGQERYLNGVDAVILALHDHPNQNLYFALKGAVRELYRVGDCVAPRRINHAIFEGNRIGRIL